ncbi:uncharacterized protein HaLaN_02143, partial [Haematococcus lacustris]
MVVTRVAGLEVVLDERRQELAECTLAGHLTVNIVPNLRVTFAQLAAGCVRLAAAIDPKTSPQERQRAVQACQAEPLPYDSSEARQALLLMLKEATAAYLSRVRAEMRAPAVKGSDGKKEVRILDGNRAMPSPHVMWLLMAITFELGIPLYGGLAHFFLHDLPGLAKPGAWSAALRSRVVQTYCKYYACLVILLMLLLGLAARDDTSEVRLYRPSIAMNAAV